MAKGKQVCSFLQETYHPFNELGTDLHFSSPLGIFCGLSSF